MEEYIRQLRATYNEGLYYFSLIGCVTLIDTCAALNSKNGETNKKVFKKWYNKHLSQYTDIGDTLSFNAEECYKFRCRLLHQSRTEMDAPTMNRNVKSGKIAFRIGKGTFHCCNFEGVYYLDIKTFMEDLINAVLKWMNESREDPDFKKNYSHMIKTTNVPPTINRPGTYIY